MKNRLLHTIAILMLAMPSFAFDGRDNLPYQIVQTRICELWDKLVINSKRPIIAIIDTGVETDHPDLLGNFWYNSAEVNGTPGIDDDNNGYIDDYCEWNFSTNTNDVTDTNGHGTICSSIAAGRGKINPQALGANPNALIMPLKVNGSYKNFSNEDIVAAIFEHLFLIFSFYSQKKIVTLQSKNLISDEKDSYLFINPVLPSINYSRTGKFQS